MASIALTSIGCIIYLALGTILTRAMFHWRQWERKLDLFFFANKRPKMFAGGRCSALLTESVTEQPVVAERLMDLF
jgi:hypothetical protein